MNTKRLVTRETGHKGDWTEKMNTERLDTGSLDRGRLKMKGFIID